MKKRRVVSFVLAAAMVASFGITAFAAEPAASGDDVAEATPKTSWDGENFAEDTTNSFDVTAETSNTLDASAKYNVTVAWKMTPGSDTNKYTYKWNPQTMKYDTYEGKDTSVTGSVSNAKIDVTVTNKSNTEVYGRLEFCSTLIDSTGKITTDETTGSAIATLTSPASTDTDRLPNGEEGTPATWGIKSAAFTSEGTAIGADNYTTAKGSATAYTYYADAKYTSDAYDAMTYSTLGTVVVHLGANPEATGIINSGDEDSTAVINAMYAMAGVTTTAATDGLGES